MRNMVKLGFIATVLLLISCSNDFPPAPVMKFCKLNDGTCKSVHVFPERDCDAVGGEIVNSCKETETGTD